MLCPENQEVEPGCGIYLSELSPGDELLIETENRAYHLLYSGHGEGFLSGHPEYCPNSPLVSIRGSGLGDNLLCANYLGEGLHMEFWHPEHLLVMTSRILTVRRAVKSLARPAGPEDNGGASREPIHRQGD
jgi:hypothetical protein